MLPEMLHTMSYYLWTLYHERTQIQFRYFIMCDYVKYLAYIVRKHLKRYAIMLTQGKIKPLTPR